MTDHDVLLLCLGANIGVDGMLLIHLIGQVLNDRRDHKALAAAEASLAATVAGARRRAGQP